MKWTVECYGTMNQLFAHKDFLEKQQIKFNFMESETIVKEQRPNRTSNKTQLQRQFWTSEDIEMLQSFMHTATIAEIAQSLNRSEKSVDSKIRQLRLGQAKVRARSFEWTKEKDEWLKNEWPYHSARQIRQKALQKFGVDLSLGTIYQRVQALRISNPKPKLWTREEDKILKENCKMKSISELQAMLPGRTESAIGNRISKFKMNGS